MNLGWWLRDDRNSSLRKTSVCLVYRRSVRASDIRSKPTHEKQYKKDDQDEADNTDAAVAKAIAVPAEAATEATKKKMTRMMMSISPIDMIHLPIELSLNQLLIHSRKAVAR